MSRTVSMELWAIQAAISSYKQYASATTAWKCISHTMRYLTKFDLMKLKFTKMHGIGNDFVVFDAIAQPVVLSSTQIRQIADRHFGVGCDQVLLVERPAAPD